MGMKMYFDKTVTPNPNEFSSTFPAMEAELTPDVIKDLKLEAAIRRFAKALYEQCKNNKFRDSKQRIIGVDVHSVNVSFLLSPTKDSSK
jgi:hypothetical protein